MCVFLTASPPRFVSVEELMETAKGVTNMALAHEIMVNQDFEIKPAEPPEGRSGSEFLQLLLNSVLQTQGCLSAFCF